MEVDECYICNDTKNDTLMTNICDCRERFIHKTCFVNLLQKTKFDNSCSVCKKKYNVTDVDEICSRGLIKKQRFYVISLVTYLFFIMTNMFVIVNIYKFYKNNFFDIKFVCTYTRDDEMGRRLSDCD